MERLQISFLGVFQVIVNGKPVTNWRSVKIQGLLVYLVMTPRQAHARERLATLFWPNEPEVVAKKNLRQALYRLRQLLGDSEGTERPFLHISRTTAQWNPADEARFDVADFLAAVEHQKWETAVDLYTGDFLPSFSCDSQPFDDWLRQERERLQRLSLDALSTLAEHNLATGGYKAAETLARQQLSLIPWREAAHRQLMQALALQGERSAAMAQYEACRKILADELGVEPGSELQTVAKAIARQQIEANGSRAVTLETGHPRLAVPFVGRQVEFEQLVMSYRRLSHEGLQLVTLMGRQCRNWQNATRPAIFALGRYRGSGFAARPRL